MKRITISLDDDLYRIAKAYAQSEDLSMSKAIVRMLRKLTHPETPEPAASAEEDEDLGPHRYRDPLTGFIVSRGKPDLPIPEDAAQRTEEEDDQHHWNPKP